ncbi:hypothetical protein ACJMK2_042567 [Sinanodonta woodiana]|uniref:Fibronectin type-III domain-containing protein n=1 Tax=Sinanodonta woodiana TaxID=1069815 RepID=A0ABD3WB43_SINWO
MSAPQTINTVLSFICQRSDRSLFFFNVTQRNAEIFGYYIDLYDVETHISRIRREYGDNMTFFVLKSSDVSNGTVLCFLRANAEWMGKNMTLSWSLPETSKNLSTRLQWHYVGLDKQAIWICPHKSSDRCPEMTLTSITWDASKDFDLTTNIEATIEVIDSPDGKVVFKSTGNYDPDDCYKPPAVDTFKVDKVTNTSITLSWSYKHSVPKVCRLNRTSEWTGEEESVSARNSTFIIYNLTAFTDYTVTIECAKLNHNDDQVGHWSDAIQLTVKTLEGLPSVSPEMTEGGYSTGDQQCTTSGLREVTVFWKKVHPKNSNGVILNYRLDVTTDSPLSVSTHIIRSDVISTVLKELLCDQTYILKLTAGTRIGFSILPSILVISAVTSNVFPRVSYVIPELTDSESIVQISWLMDKNVSIVGFNVTVLWCRRNQLSGCRTGGDVEWIKANDAHTPVNIRLPAGSTPMEFMFGVITVSNSITRGIIWNQCIFQKDAAITQPPDNVQLLAFGVEGSLHVTWDSIPCTKTRAFIQYYRITFCQVTSNSANCTDLSRNVTVDGQQTSYTIEGLDTNRLYGIQLSAGCSKGDGPKSGMAFGNPFSGNSVPRAINVLRYRPYFNRDVALLYFKSALKMTPKKIS